MSVHEPSAWESRCQTPLAIGIALAAWLPILLVVLGHQTPHWPGVAAILVGGSIGAWLGRRRISLMVLGSMLCGCALFLATILLVAATVDPSTLERGLLWLAPAGTLGAAVGFVYGLTVAAVQWAVSKACRPQRP